MKLSTRTRYGTRALIELARAFPRSEVVPVSVMASNQNLSFKYLEQIMTPLRRGGLVRGLPGPGGGYQLTKPPEDVRLSEVFRLLQEETSLSRCVADESVCETTETCPVRDTWSELSTALSGVLEATTLQDLVDREAEKSNGATPRPVASRGCSN